MNRKTKKILLGAAGAVISAAAIRETISMAIDRNMVGEALDREEPRSMQKMKIRLRGTEDSQTLHKIEQIGLHFMQMPHEIVCMESFDGTELTGHLFLSDTPRRVLLAMHGWRSTWARDFCVVHEFFCDQNCTVLYPEQRGQGGSGGEYMGFGMIERFDCLEWIRWLNANGYEKLPIYLVGVSMGAATVLMTSGFSDLPPNVTGILADCGFTSAKAEWKHISENNLRLHYDRRQKHVDSLCRKRIDLDSDSYSTLEAMKTNTTPILFVHGAADTFVPMEMTLQNYEACTAPKKLLIVEGANHGMSYVVDREQYEQTVVNFWNELESKQPS